MKKERTIEDIRAAITMTNEDGTPAPQDLDIGSVIRIRRAGKAVIPIQEIMRELKAAYPQVTFLFGQSKPIVA